MFVLTVLYQFCQEYKQSWQCYLIDELYIYFSNFVVFADPMTKAHLVWSASFLKLKNDQRFFNSIKSQNKSSHLQESRLFSDKLFWPLYVKYLQSQLLHLIGKSIYFWKYFIAEKKTSYWVNIFNIFGCLIFIAMSERFNRTCFW